MKFNILRRKVNIFSIGILVSRQKLGIFKLQSPFLGRNSHFVILKMIIVSEYQIKRISFSWNVFNFTQIHKSLFSKNEPYFCQLASVPIYKISTFPLSIEIFMQNLLDFEGTCLNFCNGLALTIKQREYSKQWPNMILHCLHVIQCSN